MKYFKFVLILTLWLPRLEAQELEDEGFRIARMMGQVRLVIRGSSEISYVRSNQFVPQKSTLVTSSNSTVDLLFPDGSLISIAENTRFRIDNLHSAKEANTGTLALVYGKILSSFKKIEKPRQIEFTTPFAVAGVRGTTFGLSVDMTGDSKLLVNEGVVLFGKQPVPAGTVVAATKVGLSQGKSISVSDLKEFESSSIGTFTELSTRLSEAKPSLAYLNLNQDSQTLAKDTPLTSFAASPTNKTSVKDNQSKVVSPVINGRTYRIEEPNGVVEKIILRPIFGDSSNLDPRLKNFTSKPQLRGELNLMASPHALLLLSKWCDAFAQGHRDIHLSLNLNKETKTNSRTSQDSPIVKNLTSDEKSQPNFNLSFEAFLSSEADLYLCHRPLYDSEYDLATLASKIELQEIQVGINALVLLSHKDNLVKSLNTKQLNGVYSENFLKNKYPIISWGVLSQSSPVQFQPLTLVHPQYPLDLMAWFDQQILGTDDLKKDLTFVPDSKAAVSFIATNKTSLGLSEVASVKDQEKRVNLIPIAANGVWRGERDTYGTNANYPYSWPMYIYLKTDKITPSALEFLSFLLSRDGQLILADIGYLPINDRVAGAGRTQLKLP